MITHDLDEEAQQHASCYQHLSIPLGKALLSQVTSMTVLHQYLPSCLGFTGIWEHPAIQSRRETEILGWERCMGPVEGFIDRLWSQRSSIKPCLNGLLQDKVGVILSLMTPSHVPPAMSAQYCITKHEPLKNEPIHPSPSALSPMHQRFP